MSDSNLVAIPLAAIGGLFVLVGVLFLVFPNCRRKGKLNSGGVVVVPAGNANKSKKIPIRQTGRQNQVPDSTDTIRGPSDVPLDSLNTIESDENPQPLRGDTVESEDIDPDVKALDKLVAAGTKNENNPDGPDQEYLAVRAQVPTSRRSMFAPTTDYINKNLNESKKGKGKAGSFDSEDIDF